MRIRKLIQETFPYMVIGMLLVSVFYYKQKYELVQKQYDTLQIIKYNQDGSKEDIKKAKPKMEEKIQEL